MSDDFFRMFELARQGFYCSQILLMLGLEAQGKSDPDLIRAMTGLAGGIGFSGKTCGALSGGACLLGLYAGRGATEEQEHDHFKLMVDELVEWFSGEIGSGYGGINCAEIMGEDLQHRAVASKCGGIVAATYGKVKEILAGNGIDLTGEHV
jgi:C_GCAxxG_C_C family probable redox protein